MCGRFNIVMTPAMVALLDDLGVTVAMDDRYNIAPTESVPIIRRMGNHHQCQMARWWLTPSWAKKPDTKYSMFNARAESLESSAAFKGPFHKKRCILPASSFIEWQATGSGKQPYVIMREHAPIVFAGLWDCWDETLLSCTMLTTQATPSLQHIHQRMPVMLDKKGIDCWLDPQSSVETLNELLADVPPFELLARPISPAINNSRNKEPFKIIAP